MEATLETTESKVLLTIRDTHTNITKIVVNGETVLEAEEKDEEDTYGASGEIKCYHIESKCDNSFHP